MGAVTENTGVYAVNAVNDVIVDAQQVGGQDLWPFLLYAVSVVGLLGATLIIASLVGARTRHRKSTDVPFESGIVSVGGADRTRLSIEFFLIAMFFVIFDLETIFIFGWAVAFHELGWRGYAGASVFIVILLVALVYEWRTGALDWGIKKRQRHYMHQGVDENVEAGGIS